MKKIVLFMMAAFAFASCVKDIDESNIEKNYNAFFEELVGGEVNKNVDWGFTPMLTASFGADGKYAGMRSSNTNSNEWGMYMYVPTEMTPAQKAKVKKYFDEVKQPQGIAINWSEFFVHQVSQTERGKYMNFLYCGEKDYAAKDHVNNFNGGSSTDSKNVGVEPIDENNARQVTYTDGIMYMYDSGTEFFAFHNSYDDTFYEDNYVIVSGEMIDALYPEAPSVAGMFFVGFDYEHDKTKMNEDDIVQPDGFYNDWVIRVSPGFYRYSERVMVEDLIATSLSQLDLSDWDFNDAVFDVAFKADNSNNQNAIITLWAAGGTKNLTIAEKEVHGLFKQPISKMINTNANNGIDGLQPVIFRVNLGQMDWNKKYTANEIVVKVGNTVLDAPQGKAPQKVVVSNKTKWMKERKIITIGYSNFASYAINNTPLNWYEYVTDETELVKPLYIF